MSEPLTVAGFLGAIQSIDAKLLPATAGVTSTNQRPGRGDLRPWKAPLTVATVPTSPQRLTIYEMAGGYWFSWSTVVNATKGFDDDDTTERFYFTGSGSPKWTNNVIGLAGGPPYPQATRELAVPAPTTTMTTSVSVAGTAAASEWSYVQTFVNDLGWESAPGPVSALVSAPTDSTIGIGNMDTAPAGAYGLTLTRIYRSITSTSGSAAFQFHSEHAIGTTTATDTGTTLGEVLATGGNGIGSAWSPPPATGFGLVKMWNGMLAMALGKTVYVCEPYTPYAYPARYEIDVADNIVALAVYGQQMLVLTDGDVYLVSGSDPASLDKVPQKVLQPCVSARSVVSFEDCVVWACPSGLWYFGVRGSFLLTTQVLDADQWAALVPTTMQCARHADLRLVFGFYNDGAAKGFSISLDAPTGLYGIGMGANAIYRAPDSKLYVLEVGNVQKWDAGASLMTATFLSKLYQMPAPVGMGALEAVADIYPVHVKVWGTTTQGSTTLVFDADIASQTAVRPKGGLFDQFQVQASTAVGSVQSVRLAEDMDDLRNG